MTQENTLEVPENIISLLKGHIPNQDDKFLRGFCSLLSYQYSQSKFSRFYENYSQGDLSIYLTELIDYINSGSSALPLPVPVKGEGTYTIEQCIKSLNDLSNEHNQLLFIYLSSEEFDSLNKIEDKISFFSSRLHLLRSESGINHA